ncbi:MAG: hypothetical protein IMF19_15885, partial [Proteobacteria bacterium]|nr:hypothetical protein [Pseudomonadota bacterium]
MNTRRKGKVILGFAIAAIIFASVFAMMIESVGAYSVGGEYNIIEKDYGKIPGTNKKSVQPVLIGQSLDFFTNWGTDNLVTIYRVKDKVIEWTRRADTGNIFKIVGDYWRRDGAFYVNYRSPTEYDVQLSFSEPDMPLEVKVGTKKVSSIAVGTKLTIDTEGMNLFPEDRVDLVVIGPDGQIKYDVINYQQFTNITVNQLADNYFTNTLKTNEWTIGDYAFWVKTNPEYACGLEAESSVKVLKILKGEIAIYAETTSTIELQTVKLAVTGVAYDEIKIESSPLSKHVIFKAGIDDAPITAT